MADKTSQGKLLIRWLKDAHAMELNVIQVLKKHAEEASDYPQIKNKIEEHCKVSERHAESVKECLQSLGEDTSSLKEGISKVIGNLQGMASGLMSDTLAKNAIMDHATEHFEMATYKAISIAATELGEDTIADKCNEIMKEEEEMAIWLENNMEFVVTEVLNQKEE